MIEYNICYSLDSKYIEQLAVSMCSVLKNSLCNEKINFYILDGGLSVEEKSEIESLKKIKDFSIKYIKMNNEEFLNCPLNVIKKGDKMEPTHVTLPAYFRIKLPSLLKELDRVLYLDCDVIVRTSLKELFEKNVKDIAVLMTLDAESQKEAQRLGIKRYFNSGILLINLDYWRKNDVENRLFDYINNNGTKILWFDQDVINVVLEDEIGEISNKWNYQYFQYENVDNQEFSQSSIIHMAGRFKPWLMPFEHPVYDLYYYYLSFTPWRKNITLYQNMSMGKRLKNGIGGSITNILVDATDEDIQKIYSEIGSTYKLIDTTKEFLESKIDFIKGYNDETKARLEGELSFVKGQNDETKSFLIASTDEKISRVYDEISKNYTYTNELVEDVKFKNEENKNQINSLWYEIHSVDKKTDDKFLYESVQTDDKISKVYDEISKNYKYTEEIVGNVDCRVDTFKNDTDVKLRELCSYSNEEMSKLYNSAKESQSLIETKLDNIYSENIKKIDDISIKLKEVRDLLTFKMDIDEIKNIEDKIYQIENNNRLYIEELVKKLQEENSKIRMKYENRLFEMEKIIASLDSRYQKKKNNLFIRLKNRIKKVIHK